MKNHRWIYPLNKYISSECEQCDDYIEECINSRCPIRVDYETGMAEMAADFDHDKRKEDRLLEGDK